MKSFYSIDSTLLFSSAPQVNAPLFFIAVATLSAPSSTYFLYAYFKSNVFLYAIVLLRYKSFSISFEELILQLRVAGQRVVAVVARRHVVRPHSFYVFLYTFFYYWRLVYCREYSFELQYRYYGM